MYFLDDATIEKNYAKFLKYIKTYITRDGVDSLIEFIESSDAKEAPSSTKYHMSCKGGNIQHSLNVFHRLISLLKAEYGDDLKYSKETIAIVALLHDISKFNFYKFDYKNVKNANGEWEKVPFITVRDEDDMFFFSDHSANSLKIIEQFIDLNTEEELAILYHMGGLDTIDRNVSSRAMIAYKKTDLAMYLHIADLIATCKDEIEVNE